MFFRSNLKHLFVHFCSNPIWAYAWGGEEEAGGGPACGGNEPQQTRWLRPEDLGQTSQHCLPKESQHDQEEGSQHPDGQNQQHLSMWSRLGWNLTLCIYNKRNSVTAKYSFDVFLYFFFQSFVYSAVFYYCMTAH